MSEQRKLRVGVIGAGGFAEICHVPGLQTHPQAEVVALCGRREEHARAMADRLNVPDVHTDYRELCAREDLDAVTITTPNAVHAEQARAAFEHGKHVFCEKPLGVSVPEVRSMLETAEASGKVHQVAFTFRYTYGVQELRRRVRAGDIGEPYYVRLQWDGWGGLLPNWKAGWREKQGLAGGACCLTWARTCSTWRTSRWAPSRRLPASSTTSRAAAPTAGPASRRTWRRTTWPRRGSATRVGSAGSGS